MDISARSFSMYKPELITEYRAHVKFNLKEDEETALIRDFQTEMQLDKVNLDNPIVRKLSEKVVPEDFPQEFNYKPWHKLAYKEGGWGLYSLEEFKKRFHILTQGIFEDLIFDHLNFNGSLIGACLYKNNYEKAFGIEQDKDMNLQADKLMRYFEHYFPSRNSIKKDKITLLDEQELSDIDIIVSVESNDEFDRVVKRLFYDLKVEDKKLFKITNKKSYKYFITSKNLLRPLELFRIFNMAPIDAIRKFHFPYVRNMFDGEEVYLFPSCILFAKKGIIYEYQYMSTSEPRAKYILKYYNRGCNFNLSDSEHRYVNGFLARHPELKISPVVLQNEEQQKCVPNYVLVEKPSILLTEELLTDELLTKELLAEKVAITSERIGLFSDQIGVV